MIKTLGAYRESFFFEKLFIFFYVKNQVFFTSDFFYFKDFKV